MPQRPISANKIRQLLAFCVSGEFNKSQAAKQLRISRSTANKYINIFKRSNLSLVDIQLLDHAELSDILFLKHTRSAQSFKRTNLLDRLEAIHSRIEAEGLTVRDAWRLEEATRDGHYKYSRFSSIYAGWRIKQGFRRYSKDKIGPITIRQEDITEFNRWRLSQNRRIWEVGVAFAGLHSGVSVSEIARKIERSRRTIQKWYSSYANSGIGSLPFGKSRRLSDEFVSAIKTKKTRLIKIIHELPHRYGINRASWSIKALSDAYFKAYGERISNSSVSRYFIETGYKFKRAKKVLMSADPNYREKLAKIKETLSHLAPNEKFFSIDEFGPFSVKMRGGVALVPGDEVRTIPQKQKSKGSLICTAALELSKNQITHFYSKKKNTLEMIKLLRRILCKYRNNTTLFITWDTASWHTSKALYKAVDEINDVAFRNRHRTSCIKLMPLPSGAQFLNVIESIFSGMSRAILHNSSYDSTGECKRAVNKYFSERNKAFLENPRRAGKKIWGKERVEAVFSEENNCKDPRWR